MSVVVVTILLAVLAFAAALVATLVVLQRTVTRTVARRHAVLEEILDSRQPPSAWGGDRRGRQLAKLRRLRRYVAVSTLVESEVVRHEILLQLDSIRDAWLADPAGPSVGEQGIRDGHPTTKED